MVGDDGCDDTVSGDVGGSGDESMASEDPTAEEPMSGDDAVRGEEMGCEDWGGHHARGHHGGCAQEEPTLVPRLLGSERSHHQAQKYLQPSVQVNISCQMQ